MAQETPLRNAAPLPLPSSIDSGGGDVGESPAVADPVLIDCDRCSLRGAGCGDCVVTFLLGSPPPGVVLDDDERRALDVLADAGLIPPLRSVEPLDSRFDFDSP